MEDCWKYDVASSSGTSNYTNLNWNSSKSAYITPSNSDWIISKSTSELVSDTSSVEISIDFQLSTTNDIQFCVGLANSSGTSGYGGRQELGSNILNVAYSTTSYPYFSNLGSRVTSSISANTWYTMKVKFENNTVTSKVYNGPTLVSSTASDSISSFSGGYLQILSKFNALYFKNIKIKKL